MKSLAIHIISLLVSASISLPTLAAAKKDTGPSSDTRLYTFRKILLDDSQNAAMKNDLGSNCVDAINHITRAGGSLKSNTLIKAIHPLSSIQFSSGTQDNHFYHWTNSNGLIDLFKLNELDDHQASARALNKGLYDKMFQFLRTRPVDSYAFWRRVFYIAKDKQSSAFLGNQLIEFTLDPQAKTISYELNVWQHSVSEVANAHPEIAKNCITELNAVNDTFGSVMFTNIFFIIAEDSGVEIVDFNQNQKWFQVLSSKPFIAIKKIQ